MEKACPNATNSNRSKKRKKSNAPTGPASPDSTTISSSSRMLPAKGFRASTDEQQPSTAPKIPKLVELVADAAAAASKTSRASSTEDDLAGVTPLLTAELADHDIGGLLDNVDFDSDTFDFHSQDGVSSNSVTASVSNSIPDVHELLGGDDNCFEGGFEAAIEEANKFTVSLKWHRNHLMTYLFNVCLNSWI